MGQNLTGQTIASTYEDLVQISGSLRNFLTDGTGSDITSLQVTASHATTAASATSASFATTAASATSASYATTASFALNVVPTNTGSLMVTGSVSSNTLTFTKGDGSTFDLTVNTGSAVTTNTGSLLVTASISNATTTFTKGDGSTFALTANNVSNASTASYVASAVLTGSVAQNTLTFTKFDGSTFNLTVNTGSAVTTNTGSLMVTGSVAGNVLTFTKGNGTTFNLTVDTGSAGATPTLQQVTTAGATTSASISITDGGTFTVDNQTNAALLTVTSDGSNTYNSTIRLGGGSGGGGNAFFVEMLPGDIAQLYSDGGVIRLNNNTEVTGSVNVSGSVSALLSSSVQSDAVYYNSTTGLFTYGAAASGGGAAAGLISGSAPRSLISANYQPTASVASGTGSIAIGNNVRVDSTNEFALGTNITSSGGGNTNTVVIGANNILQGNVADSILIGNNLLAQNGKTQMVYIGSQPGTEFANQQSVVIGYNAGGAASTVAVGYGASGGNDAVNIGRDSNLGAQGSVSVGATATSLGNNCVTLGYGAVNSAGNGAITIGTGQTTAIANEINIGGKFRFNSGSNGIIELRDDVSVSGSITATLSSSVESDVVYYNSTTGLFTYGAPTGGSTPNLQQVTSVGATTSASVSITDGGIFSVDNQAGNADLVVTSDGSNTYASTIRLGGGSGGGGNSFYLEMLPGDIANLRSDGGIITLNSNTEVTGSLRGEVKALTISSNTASMDCSTGNFFTLQLVSGSNTHINPSNIRPGQTINLKLATTGSGTVSFPSSVKQVSGSSYVPTTTTGTDIVTFISFDSSDLYLNNVRNLV